MKIKILSKLVYLLDVLRVQITYYVIRLNSYVQDLQNHENMKIYDTAHSLKSWTDSWYAPLDGKKKDNNIDLEKPELIDHHQKTLDCIKWAKEAK